MRGVAVCISERLPSEAHGWLCCIACLSRGCSKGLITIETSNSCADAHCQAVPYLGRWAKNPIYGSFGNVWPRALLLRFASEALVFRPLPALLLERLSHFAFLRRVHHIRVVCLFAGGS